MRNLNFSKTLGTEVYFPVIYEGFLAVDGGFAGIKARLAHKVLVKFEAVGEITSKDGVPTISLKEEDAKIALEETEYELLKECLDRVQWVPAALKRVVPALDWLAGVPAE